MKLIDDFFTIAESNVLNNAISVRINPNHFVFKAHFPGNPIVPGVLQIQMITELLEYRFKKPLYLNEVKNIKYITVLKPSEDEILTVYLQKIEIAESGLKVTALLSAGDRQYSKISMSYQYHRL